MSTPLTHGAERVESAVRHFSLLGNKISALTVEQLHEEIRSTVRSGGRELILNTNIHGMNLAARLPWLKEFRNSARIVHCDGEGVVLGARVLGFDIPCRITYADWLPMLADFSAEQDFSLYFLGARPGITERAAANLIARYPNLRVVGTHHGYFDKTGPESDVVVAEINRLRPNILIVGFGMPVQEQWLRDNWERIDANIFLAGGGCFDIISGDLRRAPRPLADHGLEWLFLSLIRPRRFLARYLFGNPAFVMRVLLERIRPTHSGRGAD